MTKALSVNVAGGHTWWNMRMLIIQTWRELNGEDKGRTRYWVLRGVPMGFSGSEMAIGREIFFWAEHWRLGEGTGWWQGPVYSQDSGLLPSAFPHKHMEKIRKEEPDIICFHLGSMYSTLEKEQGRPNWVLALRLCSSRSPFDKVSVKILLHPCFRSGVKSKVCMCRFFENSKIIRTCWVLLRNTLFKCKCVRWVWTVRKPFNKENKDLNYWNLIIIRFWNPAWEVLCLISGSLLLKIPYVTVKGLLVTKEITWDSNPTCLFTWPRVLPLPGNSCFHSPIGRPYPSI